MELYTKQVEGMTTFYRLSKQDENAFFEISALKGQDLCAVLWMICYFDRLHCKDLKVLIKSKIWIPTTIEIICFNNTCTQGISQQTLQSLIDFIYTGRVALCQENVQVFISNPIYSVLWLGKLPGFYF